MAGNPPPAVDHLSKERVIPMRAGRESGPGSTAPVLP